MRKLPVVLTSHRRFLPFIAVALFAFAGVAFAAVHKPHVRGAARHARSTGSDPVLLGNTTVQATSDGGTNTSEAFGYTATISGTATDIEVYLTSRSGVRAALYADSSSKPGARLATGSVTSNTAGWVDVKIPGSVQIVAGTRYWLAIASNSGKTITYRDSGSSGSSLDYSGSGLANPYSVTGQWSSNPASVYLNGTTPTSTSTSTSTTSSPTSSSTTSSPTSSSTTTSSTSSQAPGTYQLPADRTYDWNPGLNPVGGIPSGNWTVSQTISPSGGDDTATIQAALNSCPTAGVVQLTAGVFHVSGNGLRIENSYCVLRGTGPGPGNWPTGTAASGTDGTYLESTPEKNTNITIGNSGTGAAINLTSDAVRGTKSVTVANTSGLSAGQLVVVDETADPSVSHFNSPGDANNAWTSEANRPLGDTMQIASVSGDTVTFTTDFPISYLTSNAAHLLTLTGQVNHSGVEDLYSYGGYSGGGILIWDCAYCWVKHVEQTWANGEAVQIGQSLGTEVRDSYFHDSPNGLNSGGGSYGPSITQYASDSLIENNIMVRFNKVSTMQSAGGGNVWGYNYMDDGADLNGGWQEDELESNHGTTPHYALFEGNEAANADTDDRWGNAIYSTYFRNDLTGVLRDYPTSNPIRAAGLTQWDWWFSFVGNVLGTPTHPGITGYESINSNPNWTGEMWLVCYQNNDSVSDGGKCLSTVLRDGNFDYVTGQVHWHGIGGTGAGNGLTPPANSTLPDSLYLSSKPAFFGSSAWPWVDGSNATTPLAGTLPARARYDAGTPNGG